VLIGPSQTLHVISLFGEIPQPGEKAKERRRMTDSKCRLHSKLNTHLESIHSMVSAREFETLSQAQLSRIAMLANILEDQCKLALEARMHHHLNTQTP
jgi:hypothetical protein